MNLKTLKIVIGILVLMFIFNIVYFIINFYDYQISNNIVDWGVFGDYFAGTTTPLLSIMNIVVLLYISYVALNYDKLTFITRIRFDYYKEAFKHVNSFIDKAASLPEENYAERIELEIETLYEYIESLKEESKPFISEIEPICNQFIESLNELKKTKEIRKFYKSKNKFISGFQQILTIGDKKNEPRKKTC